MRSRKVRYVLIVAAVLVLAAVIVAFLPPVRAWLLGTPVPSSLKVVPVSDLGPDGAPLAHEWLMPEGDGYSTGDGGALFWIKRYGMPPGHPEWLLLRLPDRRVLAKAYGFSRVMWLPGGKAFAVVGRVTPFAGLPVLWQVVDQFKFSCYTLDWGKGGMKVTKLTDIPAKERPILFNIHSQPNRGMRRPEFGELPGDSKAPLPDARRIGSQLLTFSYNAATRSAAISLINEKAASVPTLNIFSGADWPVANGQGAGLPVLCTLPSDSWPVAMCVTGDDSALIMAAGIANMATDPDGIAVYRLTISTGKLEKLSLESTDAGGARQ